ncbi:MAG: sensor histidine kinase [Gemmatimonadaceae bacterium]|nr:sensor histidine kinase [Gemmatimonadaceae bacterium]
MRLAEFIETSSEPILIEWVAFAKSCGPAAKLMDEAALRDHASEMLRAIVIDLRSPQSSLEQSEKAKGNADSRPADPDTAAEVHGAARAWSGFTIGEMVSEYRALRSSVVRLWVKSCGTLTGADLDDVVRFNEAIDQSIAESITRYSTDLDHSKEMFLAVLGHDLRTPLGAVLMSSQFMLDTGELIEPNLTLTKRIAHSARRMNEMADDLLDFTRSQLGSGVPIVRARIDITRTLRHAVDEVEAAFPGRTFEMRATGDSEGVWDGARMSQVFVNLLSNAAQHGAAGSPIGVQLLGEDEEIVVIVHNFGAVIPPSALFGIFSPFKRLTPGAPVSHDASNLGLGLFIADRIVKAHSGIIDVTSSFEEGTSFIVRLPRDSKAPPAPLRATSRTDRRARQRAED